jgi:hypothetical protein
MYPVEASLETDSFLDDTNKKLFTLQKNQEKNARKTPMNARLNV